MIVAILLKMNIADYLLKSIAISHYHADTDFNLLSLLDLSISIDSIDWHHVGPEWHRRNTSTSKIHSWWCGQNAQDVSASVANCKAGEA